MNRLTHDEAALVYTVQMCGSDSYPIAKISGKWIVGPWRSWRGFQTCHKTKKAATEQFEGWLRMALDRWRDMKRENPDLIMTAVGIRGEEVGAA